MAHCEIESPRAYLVEDNVVVNLIKALRNGINEHHAHSGHIKRTYQEVFHVV